MKLAITLATLLSAPALVSAQVNFDGPGNFSLGGALAGAPGIAVSAPAGLPADSAAAPAALREWTIMVFINGKNNLEKFGLKDMNEMEMVGSTDKMAVVVQLGRMSGQQGDYTGQGNWTGARRYLIQKDTDTANVTSPVVQDLGRTDMGDFMSLMQFGNWAKQAYPAKKYMMIVWNHGDGWLKNKPAPAPSAAKGISYDDETNNHMTIPELYSALRAMGGVDVYGSDACLMQMGEVVYELQEVARVIVGSEETEPGDGYTYDTFLAPVAADPEMGPLALGRAAVTSYGDHYRDIGQGATQSVLKASDIPAFTEKVNAFSRALMASGEKDLAKSARDGALKFAIPENKDLYDFARLVQAGAQSEVLKAAAADLQTFVTGTLIKLNRTSDAPESGAQFLGTPLEAFFYSPAKSYAAAKGIAVYLPSGAVQDGYAELQWTTGSQWDELIAWMNS